MANSAQRAHVVVPTGLLREIDRLVGQRRRSQFLVSAAERELKRLGQLRTLQQCAGGWKGRPRPELDGRGGARRFVRRLRRAGEHRLRGPRFSS